MIIKMFMLFLMVILFTKSNAEISICDEFNKTNGSKVIDDTVKSFVCVIQNNETKNLQTSIHLSGDPTVTNENTLLIYDGFWNKTQNLTAPLLYNYTRKTGSVWMISLSKMTTVVFNRTVPSGKPITIDYSTLECTEMVDSGIVPAPIYLPNDGEINCAYNISQTFTSEFNGVLSFLNFNLPNGSLKIGNESEFKGKVVPRDVYFNDTDIPDIILNIKNVSTSQSFTGVVSTVIADCSGIIEINTTQDYSLPIPSQHPIVTECRVTFTSRNQKPLMVEILDFTLTNSDNLIMKDGYSQGDQNLLGADDIFEGSKILTKGSNLWLRLVIDTLPGNRKLSLRISETESGGRFYNQGNITLGNSTKTNLEVATSDYYYQLIGSDQIQISLTQTDITGVLEFYNGFQVLDNNLISKFGSKSMFYTITSTGPRMLIIARNFTTEKVAAKFISLTDSCNYDTSEVQGHLSLSVLTVEQKRCQWTVSPQSSEGDIVVQFKNIQLRLNDTLSVNTVGTNSTTITKFIGPLDLSFVPSINIPVQSKTQIVFSTSNNCSGSKCITRNVEADYSAASACVKKLMHPGGTISSPGWPNVYPINSQCLWADDVNSTMESKMLYMTFNELDLPNNHSLTLLSIQNNSLTTNKTFTGSKLPEDVIAKGDNYQLLFTSVQQKSNLKAEVGQGFNAQYMYLDCGDFLTSNHSNIKMNNTKHNQTSEICIWIIQLPKQKNTTVVQVDLHLQTADKSQNKSMLLEIHDGRTRRDPVLVLNNTSNHTRFLSTKDSLLIIYNASKTPSLAFELNYTTYVCQYLCANGKCLHPSWRCNGIDECGDDTDEQKCVYPYPPTTTPSPHTGSKTGVAGYWVALCLIFGIVLGVVAALFVPYLYKRIRFPNYSHLRESNNPIA